MLIQGTSYHVIHSQEGATTRRQVCFIVLQQRSEAFKPKFVPNMNWKCDTTFSIIVLAFTCMSKHFNTISTMCLARSVPSQSCVRGRIAWSPIFFLIHGFYVLMWYNSSVVSEYHRRHCSVLESMSFLGRTSMHIHDLNGDPR